MFCSFFLQKLILLLLFLSFAILFKKTKYIVQIMKCKLQMKTDKDERGIRGVWIWPHWNLLSFPGLGTLVLTKGDFEAALLHYIDRFFGENIFMCIGWSLDNLFDNLKYMYKTLVQWNLDYPCLNYPDFSIIRTFSQVPILSWIFISPDQDQ